MQTSMQYTIGTALSRAQDSGQPVEVLVEGQWLRGLIVGADGMGVVLEDGQDHCVVRLERITVVRVRDALAETVADQALDEDAIPMPGPRQKTLVAEVA